MRPCWIVSVSTLATTSAQSHRRLGAESFEESIHDKTLDIHESFCFFEEYEPRIPSLAISITGILLRNQEVIRN
jgi:hypothetical protein